MRATAGAEGRRATRYLALLSLVTAAATGLVYLFTVGTPLGQLVGELILGGRVLGLERVLNAEEVLATFSRAALLIGTVSVVALALLQRRRRLAIAALGVVIGANLTTQLLKFIVLDRTDLLDGLFYPLPNSFPSGHATAVASIAVALLLVVPALIRAPILIVSAAIVALVGVSTMVTGWHRMADAIGGTFVATSWGAGVAAILAWRWGVEIVGPRTAEIAAWGARIPIVLGSVLVVLGAIAYLVVALDPLDVLSYLAERGGSPAIFGVGVVITAGAALLSLGAFGMGLRDVQLDPRPNEPREPVAPAGE
jgi:membrane-associated phospholipid phosphatase